MAELIALSPLAGHLPLTVGRFALTEADLGPINSLAPLPGRRAALDAALLAAGLVFPASCEIREGTGSRLVWAGRDLAFLMGVAPTEAVCAAAAVTDQTDGWAALRLAGPGITDVLARLVPIDCREGALPPGRAARTQINHMPGLLLREGAEAIVLMTFRSMAATLVHEVAEAARRVAARG